LTEDFKKYYWTNIKLAIPVAIGQLGHVMLGVIDSIMVGQLGTVPLAAASLVNSLFILILILGIGMSLAITPLVAYAQGAGKSEECGIILRQALLINIVFSIVLSALVLITAELIHFLDQPDQVVFEAKSYFQILSISILPFMIFQTYRQFIDGLSDTKPAMYVAISANIINVIGNWIFIYGNLGVQAMGLDGAGISTFLTRVFMAASIMLFVINSKKFKEFDPSLKFRKINFPVIRKIVKLGIPTGFQYFFEVAAFSFSAVMIGWIGSIELAAHQIAISLASITYMISLGISAAATIKVGNFYGKRQTDEVVKSGKASLIIVSLVMGFFGICFIILKDLLPSFYISEISVISTASTLLIVAAFFQISDGLQAVGLGILRGILDVKIPMIITFIIYWMVGIPIGYLLGFVFEMGVAGIWLGLLLGLTLAAIIFTLRFYRLVKSKLS
jgi:MATE family multidrug resistance protein